MLLSTSKTFTHPAFALSRGATLDELVVAYETYGTLNEAKDNTILLCHGYTNTPHAGGDADGWFFNLLGAGKAVDTDKYFVVCANMLGSAYGSSGPASINPATGKPWGPDFPKFSTRDMIEAQRLLLDHLGVGQLKAVMGYSYGGHLTYLWGALYPDRMRALVPVAGVIERKTTTADIERIKGQFADCPGWNGGHYYGHEDEGVHQRMLEIRIETMKRYGWGQYLADTVGDPEAIERRIRDRAQKWVEQFDANSLACLYEAGIGSSARDIAGNIIAPVLHCLSRSDHVVDVAEGPETVSFLRSKGVDAEFYEIDTDYGHTGPLLEPKKWASRLQEFLETTP